MKEAVLDSMKAMGRATYGELNFLIRIYSLAIQSAARPASVILIATTSPVFLSTASHTSALPPLPSIVVNVYFWKTLTASFSFSSAFLASALARGAKHEENMFEKKSMVGGSLSRCL
ncbi:hypothetical protein ATCV1_z604L [Acanthocystis turfacea chlorella virus 1]|uniref:Uncharacterized protein z604L n=1 Tax=Chlorovirus heliozoae TaxID=322019 RepID=A7K9L4_9PHYC|nr:hypothetical protein ATCV1_z604L [Acanthocystis turfacea chlorella virus 1]ABT16738.1 hypothetical protein ATCV1_z604L [Acanthocystis turfacea chlorella virus 1]